MIRPLLIVTSLVTLAACTQAPAAISMRGSENFGRDGASQNTFAYRSPVETPQSAPAPTYSQTAFSAPTQTTAPLGSSIDVSELAPAAGTPEPQKVASAEPAPVNAWTSKPRTESTFTAKPAASGDEAKYIWPVASKNVTSAFGSKGTGKANEGINIAADEGEPVWAAADGEVVYSASTLKGYGNMVLVKHAGGKTTTYAHLARSSVEKYDRVKKGDIVGYVGSTGNVKSPQLYFAVREGTQAVDPQKVVDRKVAGL